MVMEYLFIGGHADGRRIRTEGTMRYQVPDPREVPPDPEKKTYGIGPGVQVTIYTLRSFGTGRQKPLNFYAVPELSDYECLIWLLTRYPVAMPRFKKD
jgi:hypothetical protein